jgi:hypothetical protein
VEVNYLALENEEVVTAISDTGDAEVLVCKTDEKDEQICVDMGEEAPFLERGMLDNNTYNLMEQLINENKSLWRIKNNYKNDAADNDDLKEVWSVIEEGKQEMVKLLAEKIRNRL